MFLLARPPVARWVLVGVALCVAVWADLRAPAASDQPYAAADIAAGSVVDASSVEWRKVIDGVLDPVALPAVATRPILAGDPILPGDVADRSVGVPDGWWRVELEVPPGSTAGDRVGAVVFVDGLPGSRMLEGMVASVPVDDGFGITTAVCAFPQDLAVEVAAAAAEGRLATVTSRS